MVGFGVRLFFFLTRLFGISPFNMDQAVMAPKTRNNGTSITFKLFQMLPTYTSISIYTMCLASIFWQRHNSSEISFAANWLQFLPNAFAYMVGLYMGIRYRSLSSEILTSFYLCDEKLRDNLGISFVKVSRKVEIYSYLASFVSISSGLILGFLTYRSVDLTNVWSFLYWVSFCLPKFTLMLLNLQFASCIIYVISRIRLLELAVTNYLSNDSDIFTSLLTGNESNSNKVTPLSSKRMYHTKENQLRTCGHLMEVIISLQRVTDMMNKYFGKQIVLNLLSGFICITVQLHYAIRHIRYSFQNSGSEILVTISATLIGIHFLEYLIIFGSGDKVKTVWKNLIAELHRVRLIATDYELRTKLDDIINCMCYKRVEFHGCKLFTIDLSVITGVISSIATYLIVFVQFQISEEQNLGRDLTSSMLEDSKQFNLNG